MRRRLIRLVLLGVVVPMAAQATVTAADRLEAARGPSVTTRSMRRAAGLAARRNRRR